MRSTLQLALIALSLMISVGCQTQADKDALASAEQNLKDVEAATASKIENEFFSTFIDRVGLDQGESVGMRLLLDCQQKGYRIHMMPADANGYVSVTGYAQEHLSPRVMAECESIIQTQNRIGSKRAAREKAEEKRKDDAYDKAHPSVTK